MRSLLRRKRSVLKGLVTKGIKSFHEALSRGVSEEEIIVLYDKVQKRFESLQDLHIDYLSLTSGDSENDKYMDEVESQVHDINVKILSRKSSKKPSTGI